MRGEAAMARITGVGGIFFRSPDPKALGRWYHDVLGIDVANWGGATLDYDAPGHPPCVVWCPFQADTSHFAPSSREFMINFGVDDLDGLLAQVEARGVKVLGRDDDSDPNGRFAWIMDPDGTKIELWQPK
jgi:catechol 2,3-dioxygenase-like lactoylglutathione lyase family enzyme